MDTRLRVLHVDASTGFYRVERFDVGEFFGPVDLGLHLSGLHNSLNIGTGLLCGSIFPGSNRLVFSGFSPCWGTFYISSMGGAGLVFDNLGINMLSIRARAGVPSLLCVNRTHGEEIELRLEPVDVQSVWGQGRRGVYSIMDHAFERYGHLFKEDPRILAVGPAACSTDFGAIVSVPIKNGELSFVDTWAGRGGLGSKLFSEHGIAGIIYGGTFADEDFRDRKVANEWFQSKYHQKMAVKDLDATTKYRFDPDLGTGGTFGVNYSKMGAKLLAFNYKTIYMDSADRLKIQNDLVVDHYLRQFNEEVIEAPKSKAMKNCGEPCVALCKKMTGKYKKDYEPYQTMGPLCGIFDQRAAELLNHHADAMGFDGIAIGGVLAWLMECVSEGMLSKEQLGVSLEPIFSHEGFAVETDSMHNARLGVELIDAIVAGEGLLDFSEGPRVLAHKLARSVDPRILDLFLYCANTRRGWMVPNQYWTPGVMSPMPIMGKYYMYYGNDFMSPRELGRKNAARMKQELIMDNTGFCRFHRSWAEEMVPDVIETLWEKKKEFLASTFTAAGRINTRNSSVFWETERSMDLVYTSLLRMREEDGDQDPQLLHWIDAFKKDKHEAALEFWYEIHKGIHDVLKDAV